MLKLNFSEDPKSLGEKSITTSKRKRAVSPSSESSGAEEEVPAEEEKEEEKEEEEEEESKEANKKNNKPSKNKKFKKLAVPSLPIYEDFLVDSPRQPVEAKLEATIEKILNSYFKKNSVFNSEEQAKQESQSSTKVALPQTKKTLVAPPKKVSPKTKTPDQQKILLNLAKSVESLQKKLVKALQDGQT